MTRCFPFSLLLFAAGLAACSQDNAPADAIKDAADTVVDEVDGTEPVKLAEGKYAPQDDCRDIAGAATFRANLASAVKARDIDKLAALAAPDVKLDFGGGAGAAELRRQATAKGPAFWQELASILSLGCARNDTGGITLPWYFEQDFGDLDPMNTMIVMGEQVPFYPAEGAPTQSATVSWDAVELVGGLQPERPRQQVMLPDNRIGWIATDALRSLIDYRLVASSRDGKWSFTQLIAGD